MATIFNRNVQEGNAVLMDALRARGFTPLALLGEGAEGVTFTVQGGLVAKFWFNDEDFSEPLWRAIFKRRLGGVPPIKFHGHMQLPRPFDDGHTKSDDLIVTIREEITPISDGLNLNDYVVAAPYGSLAESIRLLDAGRYKEAVRTAEFPDFVRDVIVLARMVKRHGYREFMPQIGLTRDRKPVIFDLI